MHSLYGISYAQVFDWTKRFLEQGDKGLQYRRGKRKPEESLTLQVKQDSLIKQLEYKTLKLEKELEVPK